MTSVSEYSCELSIICNLLDGDERELLCHTACGHASRYRWRIHSSDPYIFLISLCCAVQDEACYICLFQSSSGVYAGMWRLFLSNSPKCRLDSSRIDTFPYSVNAESEPEHRHTKTTRQRRPLKAGLLRAVGQRDDRTTDIVQDLQESSRFQPVR